MSTRQENQHVLRKNMILKHNNFRQHDKKQNMIHILFTKVKRMEIQAKNYLVIFCAFSLMH